jgi:tetratricopeptide (TPR) repeat protein
MVWQSMGPESAFVDLRRLADWFASLPTQPHRGLSIERIVVRLGAVCVPLLGRELGARDAKRREAARVALAQLAMQTAARPRVIAELRRIAASDACDEGKVSALGLLAELGERGAARFNDAPAIQRRSAIALASQLDNAADVAAAADMMIQQQSDDEIVHLIGVLVEASSGAAYHLAVELCARLDLATETRDRIADLALGGVAPLPVTTAGGAGSRAPRPTHCAVLVDATGRAVVVASRKVSGERRWRRWAVLIGPHGAIDDCIHEELSGPDADHGPLVASLVADGYQVATTELERARGIVAAAARHAADSGDATCLSSAYYLGRDLLDLGEAHLGGRVHAHPTSNTLGRAVELIADHDISRAQVLLARCADSADVAAATAACLIQQGRHADALAHVTRAIELEPDFPLHHWNLAATLHQLGDSSGAYHALRRFLATSSNPTGLFADPDQPSRVALATRLIAELERTARLAGTRLVRPRRKRRARTQAPTTSSGSSST